MYRAWRTAVRPPRMDRGPRLWPLSRDHGASPTSEVKALLSRWPNSGSHSARSDGGRGGRNGGDDGVSRADARWIQGGCGSIWPRSRRACRACGYCLRVRPSPSVSKSRSHTSCRKDLSLTLTIEKRSRARSVAWRSSSRVQVRAAIDAVNPLRRHLRVGGEEGHRTGQFRVGVGIQDENHAQQALKGLAVELRMVQPPALVLQVDGRQVGDAGAVQGTHRAALRRSLLTRCRSRARPCANYVLCFGFPARSCGA